MNTSPKLIAIRAHAAPKPGERLIGIARPSGPILAADAKPDAALPDSIVWMPRGDHDISASTMAGSYWSGLVRVDELGASVVIASFERARAAGHRVWLDCNHDDGAATADVRAFSWDAARGIVAKVDWTPLGERCLREKTFYSFSPTFWVDWESGRVSGLVEGHAAGGLVNAPAFGAAMPALIAARLGGAEVTPNPAPGGSPGNHNANTSMNREKMLKVLAALAVTVPADASDTQVAALYAQHVPTPTPTSVPASTPAIVPVTAAASTAPDAGAVTAAHGQLVTDLSKKVEALLAAEKAEKKKRAEVAVQAAVARGALKAEDTALQAKWVGLIEADESHVELLAALPGKPTAQSVVIESDVTQRSAVQTAEVLRVGIVDALKVYAGKKLPRDQAAIYASSISPVLRDPNFRLGPILAANNLGSLAGNLVVQRSLTLLKINFPALSAFSTDFSDVGAKFNQQIVSRIKAVPTSSNFVAGTGYAQNDKVDVDVPLTIDNHKAVTINLTANDLASTDRDLFGEQVEGINQRVGLDLTAALYALILNANYAANTVQAAAGFGRPTLAAIAALQDVAGVAQMGRISLLNSTYFSQLGQDASIVSMAAFQRPELITENVLPRVAGYQPLNCPNLGANGENLAGFCGTPDALVVATRTPNDYTLAMPGANNGQVSIVTNPDTGISVMLVQFVDHTKAQATYRVAYMFGVGVGQAASGRRILSA